MIALWSAFALVRKEMAVTAPHWMAAFALVSVSGILQMLGYELTLEPLSTRMEGGETAIFMVFLICFAVGHSLVAPEFAEGQIEFLDSLPTSRLRLFLAKLIAGALPCVAVVGFSLACDVTLATLAPTPHGGSAVWPLIFIHGIFLTGAFSGFGLGMLFSWLRGLAWGLLVLFLVVGGTIGILYPPLSDYLPLVGTWGAVEFVAGEPTHALRPLVVWTVLGAMGIGLSGLLFLGPGAGLVRQGSWATGGVRIAAMGCLTLCIGGIGALSVLGLALRTPELFLDSVEVLETDNFRVLFREAERAHATQTADEVEALSAEVAALVGNPHPVQLDIEFLGAQQNHGGVFTGGKIRLQRGAERDVVAHEMAHAHAFAVEGSAAWHQHSHMRFFSEGLANWVASRVVDNPRVPPLAAAIHAVDPVEFDLLVEDSKFTAERDIAEAYPVGEVFVEALEQVGGVDARRCVLEQTGEIGAESIAGLALWNLLAQRCDFDLDAVVVRFDRLLREAAASLPPLPTLEAEVDGGALQVTVRDSEAQWTLVCRFRDGVAADVSHYEHIWAKGGRCRIPTHTLSGTTFEYQVGFEFADSIVFTRWVRAPMP